MRRRISDVFLLSMLVGVCACDMDKLDLGFEYEPTGPPGPVENYLNMHLSHHYVGASFHPSGVDTTYATCNERAGELVLSRDGTFLFRAALKVPETGASFDFNWNGTFQVLKSTWIEYPFGFTVYKHYKVECRFSPKDADSFPVTVQLNFDEMANFVGTRFDHSVEGGRIAFGGWLRYGKVERYICPGTEE